MTRNWWEDLDPAVRKMLIIPRARLRLPAPVTPRRRVIPARIPVPIPKIRRARRRIVQRRSLSGIELEHLKRIPEKHGIDKEVFDLQAHLDRSLTYAEAKTEITRKVREIAGFQTPKVVSVAGDLEKHLDSLEFRASAGNHRARIELEFWKKQRRKI